jgi:phosphate transport system permease protein
VSDTDLDRKSAMQKKLVRRYRVERLFRASGFIAVSAGLLVLLFIFVRIIGDGLGAFKQTYIQLDLEFSQASLGIRDPKDPQQLSIADFGSVVKRALKNRFPDVSARRERRQLYGLVSNGAEFTVRDMLRQNPDLMGTIQTVWLIADDETDLFFKHGQDRKHGERRLSKNQMAWINELKTSKQIRVQFNNGFFTSGDSANPEMAGILSALVGSLLTVFVTFCLSFPIGIAAALYLEEYAPRNAFTDFIEVNINNLAAVPSVIFGLLGLAVFIGFFGLPRSAPLVGGLVLTIMVLPTIIISSRSAIRAVPLSIRDAALGMGASKMQVILHHVFPLAMPGMLTGSILGLAQALGETAPLLMIGMVAFIVDVPDSILDPATALPVQIFLWFDSPEHAFRERTSAAIIALLVMLILMNGLAIWLRRKLEKKW